jgi:hypothetical protein
MRGVAFNKQFSPNMRKQRVERRPASKTWSAIYPATEALVIRQTGFPVLPALGDAAKAEDFMRKFKIGRLGLLLAILSLPSV